MTRHDDKVVHGVGVEAEDAVVGSVVERHALPDLVAARLPVQQVEGEAERRTGRQGTRTVDLDGAAVGPTLTDDNLRRCDNRVNAGDMYDQVRLRHGGGYFKKADCGIPRRGPTFSS